MKILSRIDIDCLIKGSSWLATGGGFPPPRAREIFKSILRKNKIILKQLNEFKDDEILCVGSGVGSIKKTEIDITKNAGKVIKILENITKTKIKGIVSGEIGLECIAAATASICNVPLVDSDMKGGRAAPEPSINMFNLYNKSVLPAVAINTDEDIAILKTVKNPQKIEIFLRHFANMACGTFVAWCPRKAIDFKEVLIDETITKAINLGKKIKKGGNLRKVLNQVAGKKIFSGSITNIKDKENKGFLIRKVKIVDGKNFCEIWIKNENLVVVVNNKVKATCPDLITVIDPITNLGIHNSKLKIGQKIIVIAMLHHKKWHSKRGHKLFGPQHFQLPFTVKRI